MKVSKDLFFNILNSLSIVLFPLLTFPYASRILGPEGIGVVSFAENFCRYFMLFAALGIPIYGIREISKVSHDLFKRSKIFFEILIIHLITTLICIIFYCIIIFNVLEFNDYKTIYLLGIFYIFSNVLSIEWFFNGLSEFKFIAIRSILIKLIFVALLFLLVKTKTDVFWYFALNVLLLLFNNIINLFYLRSKISIHLINLDLIRHLKPLLYIFSTTVAVSLYVLIDTIILGFYKEAEIVGYYALSIRLNKVPLVIVVALGTVLIPKLTKAAHDQDFNQFKGLIKKSTDFVIMIGVPVTFVLFICSKPLIMLFGGVEFLHADATIKIMSSLALLIGLSNLYGMQILTPLGKDKELLKCVTFGTICSLILDFLLIPMFAEKGAALANVFSEIVVTVSTYLLAKKVINIQQPIKIIGVHFLLYCPTAIFCFIIEKHFYSDVVFGLFAVSLIGLTFVITNLFILKTSLALETLNLVKKYCKYEKV
ncbi:flippase [Pedobacter glucosidilyticus]|jgi:O-antigen/teichoic acid export membrane protein|uniref:flippase n=1 Tax=Pedobacter glucosidilyticus TaxID=1122941 RepID=UPI0026F2E553|nr:flippase [Pedobacter glucosidilyticus]